MTLVMSSSSSAHKPWMLKEYLLDDLGSCSSTGFRSFPRRNCCAPITNLGTSSRCLLSSRSKSPSSSKLSNAIRKASMAIITAVKLLPYKSAKAKKSLLPRSLSKGLFRRSLSNKADEQSRNYEIERWISSEKYEPLDLTNEATVTTTTASTTSSTNGDSWSVSDSECNVTCSSFGENGVVEGKGNSSAESKGCGVSIVTLRDESIIEAATTKRNWSDEEEEEHLSPVSVLNFLNDDEEIGSSSPFTCRLDLLEGTTEKLMQKLRRFECLSGIDPTNLESRLSLSSCSEDDDESLVFSSQSSPSPLHVTHFEKEEETEAERLLKLIKTKMDAYNFNVDSILIGFFEEGLVKGMGKNGEVVEDTLLKEAEDWLVGCNHDEVAIGWKVKEKRVVYMKDMEEGGVWRSGDVDKEEVVVQVEAQLLASLVDELVRELA